MPALERYRKSSSKNNLQEPSSTPWRNENGRNRFASKIATSRGITRYNYRRAS